MLEHMIRFQAMCNLSGAVSYLRREGGSEMKQSWMLVLVQVT